MAVAQESGKAGYVRGQKTRLPGFGVARRWRRDVAAERAAQRLPIVRQRRWIDRDGKLT